MCVYNVFTTFPTNPDDITRNKCTLVTYFCTVCSPTDVGYYTKTFFFIYFLPTTETLLTSKRLKLHSFGSAEQLYRRVPCFLRKIIKIEQL